MYPLYKSTNPSCPYQEIPLMPFLAGGGYGQRDGSIGAVSGASLLNIYLILIIDIFMDLVSSLAGKWLKYS
jgi:hypothetical protein